jgi:hypothetical protein
VGIGEVLALPQNIGRSDCFAGTVGGGDLMGFAFVKIDYLASYGKEIGGN